MKNTLFYNYNLTVDNLTSLENGDYSFYIDYEKYYFKKITRPKEDIEELSNIIKEYPLKFHYLFYNRFNSLFSEHDGNFYCLMKLNSPEHVEIDLNEILKNEIIFEGKKSKLDRTDWSELWSEKIDYLEYQVSELGNNHPIVRQSFSYYVGLAENAITYFNMLKPINAKTALVHRRISYPAYALDFYNPLDLIVDYRVRNISSYLKSNFFNNIDVLPEIDSLINKNIFTPLEYNLLFARLLYPGYYFDKIHKILEDDLNEEVLLKYIDKASEYENFLNEVFNKFSTKSSMIKINWLIKRS